MSEANRDSKSFSIGLFVPEILMEHPEKRMTARDIALIIMEKYPEAVQLKRERSRAQKTSLETDDAMIQQIVAEIGSQRPTLQKKNPKVKTTEGRPRKYYFTELTAEAESEELPLTNNVSVGLDAEERFSEHDLYPILSDYLRSELGIHSKRIDERRSRNTRGKGGNKWLFPDVVGMEDLTANWTRDVIDTAREYSDRRTKLWSFEVKLKVNSSNVREVYFQAVSNSSWANLGYLVAAEVEGSATMRELQVLSGTHGIGVIRLDADNPPESQILIPGDETPEIDWDAANRLAEENADFVDYIRLVRQFYQTGDPRENDWD